MSFFFEQHYNAFKFEYFLDQGSIIIETFDVLDSVVVPYNKFEYFLVHKTFTGPIPSTRLSRRCHLDVDWAYLNFWNHINWQSAQNIVVQALEVFFVFSQNIGHWHLKFKNLQPSQSKVYLSRVQLKGIQKSSL